LPDAPIPSNSRQLVNIFRPANSAQLVNAWTDHHHSGGANGTVIRP
jgi:hypothetical protein